MDESVFGAGFDLRDYIHKRSLDIQDLKERALYRQVTDTLMVNLFQYLGDEQKKLEQRILSEIQSRESEFTVYIGVTEPDLYDASDRFLTPICPEDVEHVRPTLSECLDQEEPVPVERVFLRQNAQEALKFEREGAVYHGTLTTQAGAFPATFSIRRSRRYLKQVERLYEVFHANHIPWSTVCSAYLYKMFDVYLVDAEGAGQDTGAEVQSVTVDFGAYEPFLHRGMIPLWNLERVEVSTSMYPSPCADHVHYEHRIFAHRLAPGCHYLVAGLDRPLQNVRLVDGDMLITCQERGPVSWDLLQLNPSSQKLRYEYEPLVNQPADSFASDLNALYQQGVKTRGELRRVILSYGYDDVVSFRRVELGVKIPPEPETYDMDRFITDKLRRKEARETMLLHFSAADPDNYLNLDLMSFLVTKAQKLFSEYVCVGILDA